MSDDGNDKPTIGRNDGWLEQQQAHDAEETRKWAVQQATILSPTPTTATSIVATAKLLVDYVYDV